MAYTVNGMSEALMFFFVVSGVWAFSMFHRANQASPACPAASFRLLAIMGGAAALSSGLSHRNQRLPVWFRASSIVYRR